MTQKMRFTQMGSKFPERTVTHEDTELGEAQPCAPLSMTKPTQPLPKTRYLQPKGKKIPLEKTFPGFQAIYRLTPLLPHKHHEKTLPKLILFLGRIFFSLTASFLGCCSAGWVCSFGAGQCSTPSTNTPLH